MKEIKDMNVGDIVYCKLMANAALNKKRNELIEEWEIVTIGRKYVTAVEKGQKYPRKIQFRIDRDYAENTVYSVSRQLYADKQEILDNLEKVENLEWIRRQFNCYGQPKYSLDQLKRIKEILLEEKNND